MGRTSKVWRGAPVKGARRRTSQKKAPKVPAQAPPTPPEPRPRTWRLKLPYETPPLSLNDRNHWAKRHKLEQQIQGDVIKLCKLAKIPRQPEPPHVILIWEVADNRRRDSDNRVATLKPAIDGLRLAGLIPDDDTHNIHWSEPIIRNTGRRAVVLVVQGVG